MKYAFVETTTCCYESLVRIAKKLGKKMQIEVVDVNRYDAMKPQIVVVSMNTLIAESFFRGILKEPERAENINYLFIEQFGYHLPEGLEKIFTIMPINLDYKAEIPSSISLKELTYPISEQVKRESLRSKEQEVLKEISKRINIQFYKPKKEMSEVKKFLFKKQLERYGTLEEIWKELQNN